MQHAPKNFIREKDIDMAISTQTTVKTEETAMTTDANSNKARFDFYLSAIKECRGLIFGGAVRDMVSRQETTIDLSKMEGNDLDLLFPSESKAYQFIEKIASQYTIKMQQTPVNQTYGVKIFHKRLVVSGESVLKHIDVVVSNVELLDPDANVNKLQYNPYNNLVSSEKLISHIGDCGEFCYKQANMYEIVLDCLNKRYRPEPGMAQYRKDKMKENGWVEVQ